MIIQDPRPDITLYSVTMQSLHFILTLWAVATSAVALPQPVSQQTSTDLPAFMTIENCKSHINIAEAKKPLFWGQCMDESTKAVKDSNNYGELQGYAVLATMWKDPDYPEKKYPAQYEKATESIKKSANDALWGSCSQVLAQTAEGTAYVMFPGTADKVGLEWTKAGARPNSIWGEHEYPNICRNSKVTKLVRLSSKDAKIKEDLTAEMKKQRDANKCPEPKAIPTLQAAEKAAGTSTHSTHSTHSKST